MKNKTKRKAILFTKIGITALVILIIIFFLTMQISTHSNNNQQPTTGYQVAASGTYNIAITDYMFSPSQLIIGVGDIVIWTNDGSMGHTLTSDSGSELNSPIIASGSTYSHTFNIAGTYNYHCSIHSSMIGQIIVQ